MSFYEWLIKKYAGVDNWIGDLAEDAQRDRDFPRALRDREPILRYLCMKHACSGCLEAFKTAFRRYVKSGAAEQ